MRRALSIAPRFVFPEPPAAEFLRRRGLFAALADVPGRNAETKTGPMDQAASIEAFCFSPLGAGAYIFAAYPYARLYRRFSGEGTPSVAAPDRRKAPRCEHEPFPVSAARQGDRVLRERSSSHYPLEGQMVLTFVACRLCSIRPRCKNGAGIACRLQRTRRGFPAAGPIASGNIFAPPAPARQRAGLNPCGSGEVSAFALWLVKRDACAPLPRNFCGNMGRNLQNN